MNSKRPILYMLLIVIVAILIYNFVLAPMLVQQNWQMGMGMHSRMGMYNSNNYSYSVNFWVIILAAIVIGGLILLDVMLAQNNAKSCGRCGHNIENEKWKICPICGSTLNRKG